MNASFVRQRTRGWGFASAKIVTGSLRELRRPGAWLLATLLLGPLLTSAHVSAASDRESTIMVTSTYSSGPGSIRDAIERANRSPSVKRIVSKLPARSVVYVFHQLPPLSAAGVAFDAAGMTLSGATCIRPDGRPGCDGLLVTGPNILVRNLRATAFTFDGIAVRGPEARRARVEACEAFRNGDDGIGISAGATDVLVKGCTLKHNGYRTKGKGVLVFDHATAELVGNTIHHNRDGVTVSRRAVANLIGNTIADNYDKGLGVTGAEARGRDNLIVRNGRPGPQGEPAPNADGLRVTLDGKVSLANTRILDNGDAGLVAIGQAKVCLDGGRIAGNGGFGVHARERADVELIAVTFGNNTRGRTRIEEEAKLVQTRRR